MMILNLKTGLDARMLLRLYGVTQTEYGRFLTQFFDKKRIISRQQVCYLLDKHRNTALPKKYREALHALLEEKTVERWQKYPISYRKPQEQP